MRGKKGFVPFYSVYVKIRLQFKEFFSVEISEVHQLTGHKNQAKSPKTRHACLVQHWWNMQMTWSCRENKHSWRWAPSGRWFVTPSFDLMFVRQTWLIGCQQSTKTVVNATPQENRKWWQRSLVKMRCQKHG